jgi:hypothetical protein
LFLFVKDEMTFCSCPEECLMVFKQVIKH